MEQVKKKKSEWSRDKLNWTMQWKKWQIIASRPDLHANRVNFGKVERWWETEWKAGGRRTERQTGGSTDLYVKNINYRRWRNDERQPEWRMDGAKDKWWSGERKQKRKNIREREQASVSGGCQRREVVPGWLAEKEPTVDKCGKMWGDWCQFLDSLLMHVSTHMPLFFL